MRRDSWMKLLALATLSISAVGCSNNLKEQNAQLQRDNRELEDRVAALEGELARRPDSSQVQQLQGALAQRDAMLTELRSRNTAASGPSIPGVESSFDARTGEMTLRISGDVLFDSGQATLKTSSQRTLNRVIDELNGRYAGMKIRVEGHTDSDPVRRTRSQWQDNRNLSLGRALAVTRYLESKGVSAKRIATVGYGEHHPRGSEKSRNRRVEIVVVTRPNG